MSEMKLWALSGSYWVAIVRAETEDDARDLFYDEGLSGSVCCTELSADGPSEIILVREE